MGEVWRGVDVGWGGVERPVAVKVIAPELAQHAEFVKTFIDEARLSYLLSHANVVHVRDIGQTEDGACFIAMEWVDGVDLGSLLRAVRATRQPFPTRFAALIAIEIARGLDYAHRLRDENGPVGLVHRDVSPANVLISYEGEVKISDFGIARSRLREAISLPGAVKGKYGYMAPEQARAEEVDARVDVFALGVVLYEMVTGQNPYVVETGRRDGALVERVRKGVFRAPGEVAPVAPGLETIILRAMAPVRDERYVTCAALRDDLEAFARREGWALSTAQLGAWVRGVVAAQAEAQAAATGETPPAAAPSASASAVTAPGRIVRRDTPEPDVAKGFDAVLGAGLAALSGEPDESPASTEAPPAPPPTPPRTVALHPVIAAPSATATAPTPPVAPAPSGPRTSDFELVPARRRRWPAVLALGLLAVGASVAISIVAARDDGPAPTDPAATAPTPTPSNAPAAVAQPAAPAPASSTVAARDAHRPSRDLADERARDRRRAALATLTITTDAEANVFVDGRFVDEAPATIALPPGRHTIRVEGTVQGLRLMPKEETVELAGGEIRRLQLDLR